MTFNNIFNFGFSPSIKETYFEQFLALIFSFASSFTRTSQSLFPSLYGTDNFLALVSFPLSSVLFVVFVAEEEEEEEEKLSLYLLLLLFYTHHLIGAYTNEREEIERDFHSFVLGERCLSSRGMMMKMIR